MSWIKTLSQILFIYLMLVCVGAGAEPCSYMLGSFNALKAMKNKRLYPEKAVFFQKLNNTARLISEMNHGQGPDLLGLVEIDKVFIERLSRITPLREKGYLTVVVSKKPDVRGNNVGLISKFPLLSPPVSHVYWDEKDPLWRESYRVREKVEDKSALTRPILEVRLGLPNGEELIVFVNHWPSRHRGDWSVLQRQQASIYLKNQTDKILAHNSEAKIMIFGDFNSGPWGPEMKAGLKTLEIGSQKTGEGEGPSLINLNPSMVEIQNYWDKIKEDDPEAAKLRSLAVQRTQEKYGSHYYYDGHHWESFDQVIVSSALLKNYVPNSFSPYKEHPFVTPEGKPKAFDIKNGDGLSDHFPVTAAFVF